MNAPRGLASDGRRAWHAAVAALEQVGVDAATIIGGLERYARSVDRLAAVEAAWVELGRPATSEGSQGQTIAHPLLGELRAETAACQKLAEALLPAQVAGWRRGQARSPDRQARGPARRLEVVKLMPPGAREALGDR